MQNPLESYRRTQREIRKHFDAFTHDNCAACPTPCCRRPARILPTDIILAESTGWKANLPIQDGKDMTEVIAGRAMEALSDPPESGEGETDGLPCEFLGDRGCSFPNDLRPFGCTAFICKYMFAKMDRPTLTKVKRLVRELEDRHHALLKSARPGKRNED